jgi:hypothetical protein
MIGKKATLTIGRDRNKCKVCFTSVFTQTIDLYTKNENNLHETLINQHTFYITFSYIQLFLYNFYKYVDKYMHLL